MCFIEFSSYPLQLLSNITIKQTKKTLAHFPLRSISVLCRFVERLAKKATRIEWFGLFDFLFIRNENPQKAIIMRSTQTTQYIMGYNTTFLFNCYLSPSRFVSLFHLAFVHIVSNMPIYCNQEATPKLKDVCTYITQNPKFCQLCETLANPRQSGVHARRSEKNNRSSKYENDFWFACYGTMFGRIK